MKLTTRERVVLTLMKGYQIDLSLVTWLPAYLRGTFVYAPATWLIEGSAVSLESKIFQKAAVTQHVNGKAKTVGFKWVGFLDLEEFLKFFFDLEKSQRIEIKQLLQEQMAKQRKPTVRRDPKLVGLQRQSKAERNAVSCKQEDEIIVPWD